MYATGERPRWMSQDYQSGKFEDRFVLPKEKFQESMILPWAPSMGWLGVWEGGWWLYNVQPSDENGSTNVTSMESMHRLSWWAIYAHSKWVHLAIYTVVIYRPGRRGLANPRAGPWSRGGLTSSCKRSSVISSGPEASIYYL